MTKWKRTVGLIAFLKGNTDPAVGMPGCANYDHHCGGCLFCWKDCKLKVDEFHAVKFVRPNGSGHLFYSGKKCLACDKFPPHTYCKVEQGQRCWYFEEAVLPTSTDIGLKEHVYSLYERQVGAHGIGLLDSGEIRKCPDCGAPLLPRRRYCDRCKDRRRGRGYRK